MRYLKPVRGGRKQISSRVEDRIRNRVERDSIRYNCSKSFVINTILASFYNIVIEEHYDEHK